jgi:hypothetical protein
MIGVVLNLTVFLLVALLITSAVYAGSVENPGVQARTGIQEAKIDQGIESGQLTPREAGRLGAEQAKIKQDEARMKSDGNLTGKEKAKLHGELDRSSRQIHRQKHDRQKVTRQQTSAG